MKTMCVVVVIGLFAGPAFAQSQENSGTHRPVSQQEIDRLKRQIEVDTRSSVEAIFDHHTESGNDLNKRLDLFRYGGRLNLKMGSASAFQLTGTNTHYLPINEAFNEQGTNLTAGIHSEFSESVDTHIEAGATRFSTESYTINALASVRYNPSDVLNVYAAGSRSNVEESLLSTAGLRPVLGPFAGELVGRVMENRFVVGGSSQLFDSIDIFAEGGFGNRAGSNVPKNPFKTFIGGAGYSIIARPEGDPLYLVRAAYELNYFGFEEDRFGFGGASFVSRTGVPLTPARIGNDGISPVPAVNRAGIGGYFSPSRFVSNVVRVEAKGGSDDRLSYKVSGFIGSQNYTGTSSRRADGFAATVSVRLSDRVTLPVTCLVDNFGPFTQRSLYARLAVTF